MTLKELEESGRIILKAIRGSHLYNLAGPESDLDEGGMYLDFQEDLFRVLGKKTSEVADERQDKKYFALSKVLDLLENCNPNIIELLYIPADKIIYKTDVYDQLCKIRKMFITKKACNSFYEYALDQLKKAHSLGKQGNNYPKFVDEEGLRLLRLMWNTPSGFEPRLHLTPRDRIALTFGNDFVKYISEKLPLLNWTEEDMHKHCKEDFFKYPEVKKMMPPVLKDFVYLLSYDENGFPARPQRFTESPSLFDASRIERCTDLYRLYRGGFGFISDDGKQVKLTSITKERERTQFVGIAKIDVVGYEKAIKEWRSFWVWMNERNEKRHKNDVNTNTLVDNKNLMHTVRLLLCAKYIAKDGEPKIVFDGDERQFLLDIKAGKYTLEQVMEIIEDLKKEIKELFDECDLPEEVNKDFVNGWFTGVMLKDLDTLQVYF